MVREYIKAERGVERMRDERHDCTVRALACAKGISYDEAHACMNAYGRESRRGVKNATLTVAYESAGFKMAAIFGTTKKARFLKHCHPDVPNFKGTTLKKLLPILGKGRYIVGIRGHVFAVVDGVVMDYGYLPTGLYVTNIYKLG